MIEKKQKIKFINRKKKVEHFGEEVNVWIRWHYAWKYRNRISTLPPSFQVQAKQMADVIIDTSRLFLNRMLPP